MDPLALVVAAVAAGAILLIVIGLAGNSPVDPVQARLTQLGSMQAKNLEELELQQPLIDRTIRPLVGRLSGSVSRVASTSFTQQTEKRLALAGNPGNMRVADWLGIKAVGAIVGAILFTLLFIFPGVIGFVPFPINFIMLPVGLMFGYTIPEFWLGGRVKKRQKAVLMQIPDALDLLTISVRAGLGFDGALGKVVEKLKGPLTEEFRRALAEIRVGKPRRDALRDIIPRTEVPALTNCSAWMIAPMKLVRAGTSVRGMMSRSASRRKWPPRPPSRCCSRSSGASSRRCSSSSSGPRSS